MVMHILKAFMCHLPMNLDLEDKIVINQGIRI